MVHTRRPYGASLKGHYQGGGYVFYKRGIFFSNTLVQLVLAMARMVSLPFIFQSCKYYVLIRFSETVGYSSLRSMLLNKGLLQIMEDNGTVVFDQGYLLLDRSMVLRDPTAIKWLLLATLDEYFRAQKALKLFGGPSFASAS
jgi:hypothetical protein